MTHLILRASRLFLLPERTPPLSPTYALPLTPGTALLAPIYCDDVPESEEIFLCQPYLGLNLKDPTFA